MQRALLLLAAFALAGCRAPSARIDPFAPAGPQRVPAPTTGSLGTPTVQPASPYYPTGLAPAPTSGGAWQPAGSAGPSIAGLGTPTFSGTASTNANANSQFGSVQPTSPAVIHNQALPVNTGSLNNQPMGIPAQPVAPNPWQPAAAPQTNSGSFFNASAPSTNLSPNNIIASPPATNVPTVPAATAPQGGSMFSQPPTQFPVPVGPAAPASGFNGMPLNDATSAYPQPPQNNNLQQPAWNVGGLRNWIQSQPWLTTQANPTFNTGAPVAYNNQLLAQPTPTLPTGGNVQAAVGTGVAVPTPTAGYSTVPASTALPMRGMPNAVAPATWTTPAMSPTPASPTAANMTMPATVRGNLDSDARVNSFIPTAQSSPTPHTAEMYGHHDQYLWLRGRIEYSSIDKRWKLRYIPLDAAEGRIDNYGGSVVLVETEKLSAFESGDFVMVRGRVGEQSTSKGFAPLYHVEQVSPLE